MEKYLNKIINGDCLEVMKGMPENSVDAIVTDPPFGIGFKYGDKKDVANSVEDYTIFTEMWLKEAKRIAKEGALFAIWQPALYFKHFWEWFGDDIHIYAACKNFVQLRKTPVNYAFDPVVIFYNGQPALRPQKPKRNVDFFVSNTAALVSKPSRLERQHPCPRPLDVVTEIVENFSEGLVLDPFGGSGTVGVACKNLGREFILIEKEKEYCEIAEKRISEVAQKLF